MTLQGPVALAQSDDIHINTIKLSCLFCSQAFLPSCLLRCSPRLLYEYQFSVDCSPDVRRFTASCAYGRLAGIVAVQALHEGTQRDSRTSLHLLPGERDSPQSQQDCCEAATHGTQD